MWNANFVAQTPSIHSTPRSLGFGSRRGSDYDSDRSSETAGDGELTTQNGTVPLLWQDRQDRLSQKLGTTQVAEIHPQTLDVQIPRLGDISDSESRSQSRASTQGGDREYEYPEKTPTMLQPMRHLQSDTDYPDPEYNEEPPPRVMGPLEQQLSMLMSKIVFMESENPTVSVTPEDYQSLQDRVKSLEAENQRWRERYEAIFALRDEDVANLIKVRGLLADERHKHAEMRKLRDDDIVNVVKVRGKLADAVRKLDGLEKNGGSTPPRRPLSTTLERRNTTDLFQAAKTAALEQRALELEKANEDLVRQLNSPSSTGKSTEEVTRLQNTIHNLKARLNQKDEGDPFGANPRNANNNRNVIPADWNRIQAMLEENAKYREKMGGKVQQLRSEKEVLQKELNRKDDENADLEARLERYEREVGAGAGR
ncbi:hypothetical protein FQN54_008270 [Arachnomyces sp. PD_36]|nr:hypothetical protein FQN54_008270 [Arachnomyces sp. PD_36]